ncbi:MAG TPA: aspartate aminotransferase family protein [Acetobacteraceae bacterium]|nr:aspartate aminotransferase family protein [Acetobacteraceae bacterium]
MQDRIEGDINLGDARADWQRGYIDAETQALLDEDARWFLHQALSTPCLNVVERAEGIYLIDTAGRRIMDFHGNTVHQVGYGHPRVIDAVTRQLATLPFAPRRYTNRAAIELARRLAELSPGRLNKVLFAPSGTAAIGMALKLARHATGRHKTLSMWDAFHGASLDAISVGGEAIFRRDAGPLLPGTEHVPPPAMAERFFGDDGHAAERLADYIDYVLDVQGDVGAVIAEPVRWTTLQAPPANFWPRVRTSCDRHGVLLIFDEIPSCLGRTGTMFACEQVGCVPDMLVLGKGLGGGVFPMAALIARDDLDVAADRALGHYTHEKSSVGCAAALATLDVIRDEGLLQRSRELGAHGLERLRRMQSEHASIRAVRGLGVSFGVEVASLELAEPVMYRCLTDGLSFKVGSGNVLTLCPPLTITHAELDGAFDILDRALLSLRGA